MCGILAVLGAALPADVFKGLLLRLEARGPEGFSVWDADRVQMGFTRLAINGLNEAGMQPMHNTNNDFHWMCNGEIYNWRSLAERYGLQSKSGSDCEIIGPLFQQVARDVNAKAFFQALDGVFATVFIDTAAGVAFIGRDPYGVRPLFQGITFMPEDPSRIKRIVFASEMKAMPLTELDIVVPFQPGSYAVFDLKTLQQIGGETYHTIPWIQSGATLEHLAGSLEAAVSKRMMTERPVAALLSGGLDSSLIAALAAKALKAAGAPRLKTFSIGFPGSEDLRCARIVSDHIGSDHTEVVVTPDDFWAAIPEVIRDIESYDITTVRASVGNWLVSKYIRENTECKVVFNGDGSDEVLGGYLYFYNAPSDEAFDAESARLLQDMHYFDVLRSDRCISTHGLEARTPFLDKQFVAVARSFNIINRRPKKGVIPEKWLLRQAFATSGLLPDEILWRRKEAFSDGVSGGEKSWYQICKEKAEAEVAVGSTWETDALKFTHLTPKTAEAYYYRTLFNTHYSGNPRGAIKPAIGNVPYHWMPKWSGNATDPSARTLNVYSGVEKEKEKEKENENEINLTI
jgi:asparagine synthase (glutamine-hydrolysing)